MIGAGTLAVQRAIPESSRSPGRCGGKARYARVTLAPLAVLSCTTLTAGWRSITDLFVPMAQRSGIEGWFNATLTAVMMACVVAILAVGIVALPSEAA